MSKTKVLEGFKQSELGLIPEDWQFHFWGEVISHCSSGATPYRGRPDFYKGSQKWLTSGELNYRIVFDTNEKITQEAVAKTNLKLHPAGTFMMAITGLEAAGTRGACAIIGAAMATNQSCMAIYPNPKMDNKYFFHFYVAKGEYLAFRYCQGTKQQSYTAKLIKLLPIVLPATIEEQKAIAKVLSDTDELIESLEQLIDKKRLIKKGAMQELLTGKRRLPGFKKSDRFKQTEIGLIPEDWQVRLIGNLLKIRHGKSQHEVVSPNGKYPILATGGQIGNSNRFLYDKPSVLIGRKGTINKPQFMEEPFWTVDTLFYSEIFEPNSARFMFYKFCMIDWQKYDESSGVPSLNAKTIEKVAIVMPDDFNEQKAIAIVLSDMDAEIEALENKLGKYRQIKQGMMEKLLTGKIRLV